MKLIFKKDELMQAINIAQRAISSRTTDEILNCIHLRAHDDIRFTASDGDLWIKTEVTGEVVEEGEMAIPAKRISECVRKMPNDEIIMETDTKKAGHIKLYSGDCTYSLSYIELEGYSDVPEIDATYKMSVNGFSLREMIKKSVFCSAPAETANPLMSGEFIEIEDDSMKMTAIDGSRIAICRQELDSKFPYKSCIVPARTLNEISRIIRGEKDEMVELVITDKHILFIVEGTIILSSLIAGQFFNIKKMLSADYELKLTTSKDYLLQAVDRAMPMTSESDSQPLIMSIKDQLNLHISSSRGDFNDVISIQKDRDIDMLFGLNPRFLLEALRAIDDEEIDMYFINRLSPMFIRDEKNTYIYVLLPVNFVDEEV